MYVMSCVGGGREGLRGTCMSCLVLVGDVRV